MLKTFKAYQLAKEYYELCRRQQLPYYLRDQLNRASSSVALNLAEGSAKISKKEQQRFYSIALGSLRECQAIIDLRNIKNEKLIELGNSLGAIVYALAKPKTAHRDRDFKTDSPSQK